MVARNPLATVCNFAVPFRVTALFLGQNTFPKVPSGNKQSTASCLRRLRVLHLSQWQRHPLVFGSTLVSCSLVSVWSLAIFCQAEKDSWIRTTSAVTAPSTRQHESSKIRFLVLSLDTLGVQKKGGFPAKVGLRRQWRVLPGKSQDTFTSALALRLTCVLGSTSWARSAQRQEEPLSTTMFWVGVLGSQRACVRPLFLLRPFSSYRVSEGHAWNLMFRHRMCRVQRKSTSTQTHHVKVVPSRHRTSETQS